MLNIRDLGQKNRSSAFRTEFKVGVLRRIFWRALRHKLFKKILATERNYGCKNFTKSRVKRSFSVANKP